MKKEMNIEGSVKIVVNRKNCGPKCLGDCNSCPIIGFGNARVSSYTIYIKKEELPAWKKRVNAA